MSFVLGLRLAAANHPNVLRKKLLRDAADQIEKARRAFELMPVPETLRELNGAWSNATRIHRDGERELGVPA